MSEFNVPDDIKELISEIISKNKWELVSEPKYSPACETGDGYLCIHLSVEIPLQNDTLKLFIKYPAGVKLFEGDRNSNKVYMNEVYFYNTVIVRYNRFLEEKNIISQCVNAPKSYGTSPKNAIVLENLMYKGYKLFDRRKFMNDQHIKLVFKSFARWHGTSFAFKDQRRSDYEELAKNCGSGLFKGRSDDDGVMKVFLTAIKDAFDKLDPEEDRVVLEKCTPKVLMDSIREIGCSQDRYTIITKGDCWMNNLMFLYEDNNMDNPIDVMHVDWQLIEVASTVYDLSYFFYSIASEEALANLDNYLKFYHSELSKHVKNLGSDAEDLYPFHVFKQEWKLYSKFGFALAFVLFKVMLINQDDVPDMRVVDGDDMFAKFNNQGEYVKRVKILARFFVERDYI